MTLTAVSIRSVDESRSPHDSNLAGTGQDVERECGALQCGAAPRGPGPAEDGETHAVRDGNRVEAAPRIALGN